MKIRKLASRVLAGVLVAAVVVAGLAFSAQTAGAGNPHTVCVGHKSIEQWNNLNQLGAQGFYPEIHGEEASLTFNREQNDKYLSLDVAPSGDGAADYAASRITEIDAALPVGERVKCWQPTDTRNLVAEFEVRFDQPVTPGLTENLVFWNAPFGENPIPITTIGVSRSLSTGGMYAAVVAQDLVLEPFSGLMEVSPMPSWLDDTAWHRVRITVSSGSARIEVAQGEHPFTTVLETALLHPPEPLGFEFSIDNEALPGMYIPVPFGDGVDVTAFEVGLVKK